MKNLFIIFVIIFVLALVAFVLTGFQPPEQTQNPSESEQTSRPAPPPAGVPAPTMYNLSGTLLMVQGDTIRFGANVQRTEEGVQLIEEKVARISSTTQIVRFQTVTDSETGAARVQEQPITLGDLQPGDRIQVISNRDILTQTEIQATKIRLLGRN